MFRRLLPVVYRQLTSVIYSLPAVLKQQTCNSSYFCFNTAMPVIPPCYWCTLANGVRVITEQTANPLACVTLIANAGSRYETACNNGACHFFELMATRGLLSLHRCPFQEFIREKGAYLDIHTDREYQAFICRCPHDAVYDIINILSRLFCELECNEKELMCAKSDAHRVLSEIDNNHKKLCYDYLHQTAFQGTPLACAPEGPIDNYTRFDEGFITAFVAQHYQPFRLVVSVSSIHSHSDVACKVQSEFGYLRRTTNELVNWPTRYTGSMLRYRDDSLPFCHIAIGVETGGYGSKDFMGLHMMKHIIGRWDESQCQLYNSWPMLAHACAVSKLCYRFESFYLPYSDVGLFGIYFPIKKEDDYEDAILMIQDQWMNMCTSLTNADVDRATQSLKLELAKSVEGCVATCLDMGLQMMYNGCRMNLLELFDQVKPWRTPEVSELAYKVLYDRCPAVSAVGPTEAVPDYNRTRAGMYWLRF